MVCSWLAGSVRAESVAASRMERALSEVASSLNGHMSRHGSQQSWLIQAQIWLQLGMHAHTHSYTHVHLCACAHTQSWLLETYGFTHLYTPSLHYSPPPLPPIYTYSPNTGTQRRTWTQAHRDTLGHRYTHTQTH